MCPEITKAEESVATPSQETIGKMLDGKIRSAKQVARAKASDAAAKPAAAKKTSPKAKPKAAKKAAKKPGVPRAKKVGLRKPQLRILTCLVKSKNPLTRAEIAEKAPCDIAWLNSWIGSHDEKIRAKNDKKLPSLLTLGLVRFSAPEEGVRGACYEVTAFGRKALEKSKQAE